MPVSRREEQPWYSSVTIDLIIRLANKSIFHPFICCLLPICLRAAETPWDQPAMVNTIYWASFITIISIIGLISDRVAWGEPRELDHEEEVIVITGGASGLGRCIAEIYALKGGSVAVLDTKGVDEDAVVEGVEYYECDITDRAAVEKCWEKIKEDLGLPTILINNAGIVHGKKLLDLSNSDIHSTFTTNALSHYYLNQLFLPPLKDRPSGGTLITISSVLGRLGAAQLSDYTASKAALIAMHNSLAAELIEFPKIKTILVTPGQLSTEMFTGLKQGPIAHFFGPIVEVSELAVQLVKMINNGEGGVLAEPAYARWIGLMDVMPVGIARQLRRLTGVDTAMASFQPSGKGKMEDSSSESVELI